ncbi:MAG: biotin-dependent carboxyltransferase [Acidobacteria bacterium]|nr:biotin-dependent carboxyltransferase [Acidobacteriota bacterium]
MKILKPGFLTSIQDAGRCGVAHMGVARGGAGDAISMRLGNLLVGNDESTAAIEMTLVGGTFESEEDAVIAITGGDFELRLDGTAIPLWTSQQISAGQTLSVGPARSGVRCYLCIRGGVDVPLVLGSASMHFPGRFGGLDGRVLVRGQVVPLRHVQNAETGSTPWRVRPDLLSRLRQRAPFRVTEGPQHGGFEPEAFATLTSSAYEVLEDSNRVGLRLRGPQLRAVSTADMLTEGAPIGAIQVPPDGQPIILFVDQPTTGGYPKIANVISADIHRVGQLRPRDQVHFERVSFARALELLQELEALIGRHALEPA